jgi:hypothetical protein
VKDYGMKTLAVNYKNPYTHPQAKINLINMINALGVDFVQFHFEDQLHQDLLKHYLSIWLKKPSAATAPFICIGCRLLWIKVLQIAKKEGIDCIISGGNPLEYTSFKEAALGLPQGATLNLFSPNNILRLSRVAMKNIRFFTPKHLGITLKSFLFTNPYAIGPRLLGRGIEKIDLFHFIKWDENEVVSRISSELGWSYPAERKTTWRFDCKVGDLKDYMFLETLGMTERDDFYSKMIREGLISRDNAINRIANEGKPSPDIVEEFFSE